MSGKPTQDQGPDPTPEESALAQEILDARKKGVPAAAITSRLERGVHVTDQAAGDVGVVRLLAALGTRNEAFASWSLNQLVEGLTLKVDDTAGLAANVNAALGLMHGMKPRDEVEGMLLAQMAACHQQAMRGAGRLRENNSLDALRTREKAANAFMRTFVAQMEALKRYRSKGVQTVRVERVYVGEGGQAIVGNVNQRAEGAGAQPRKRGQSHAKQQRSLAHAPEPALCGAFEAQRDAVSEPGGQG